MRNFLQFKSHIQKASVLCWLGLHFITAIHAQTDVLGKDFSIVTQPSTLEDGQLLSFESESFTKSIALKWTGHFSGSIVQFEVQRATDGIEFETISSVDVKLICGKVDTYCYEDKNVKSTVAYFYRFKYTTKDQLSFFSNTISAKVNTQGIVIAEAFPNPFKEKTTLQYILSNPSLVTVEISNDAGKIVKRFQQGLQNAGRYALPFSAKEEGLPAGKYVVTIWFDDENYQLVITESE